MTDFDKISMILEAINKMEEIKINERLKIANITKNIFYLYKKVNNLSNILKQYIEKNNISIYKIKTLLNLDHNELMKRLKIIKKII